MKTVVITGSARGLGFEMAKNFRKNDFNVVLSDINEETLNASALELEKISSKGKIEKVKCNVCALEEVENLFLKALEVFKTVDIWINNAGVNQPSKHAWDLTTEEIDFLIEVDLKGAINGSKVAVANMLKQGYGAIYNVEGFGSNDAYQEYLVMYGTAKRAVTYFTTALAKEVEIVNKNIIIGKLSPGIMITKFLTSSQGTDGNVKLSEKTKKVYNILGDYPDVVSEYLVKEMIKNKKNDKRISWLTNGKAFKRFLCSPFSKRDFFKE